MLSYADAEGVAFSKGVASSETVPLVGTSEAEQERAERVNQGDRNPRQPITRSFRCDRPQEAIYFVLDVTVDWVENRIT